MHTETNKWALLPPNQCLQHSRAEELKSTYRHKWANGQTKFGEACIVADPILYKHKTQKRFQCGGLSGENYHCGEKIAKLIIFELMLAISYVSDLEKNMKINSQGILVKLV